MSESCANRPCLLVATTIFDYCDVTWFARWRTIIIGLEWIVTLEDYNVCRTVASKFSDFNKLNIGEFIPFCISVLIGRDPYVLPLGEIAISIIPQNCDGMCTICCDGDVIVTIAIEVAYCNVMRVTVCGIRSSLGSACCSC